MIGSHNTMTYLPVKCWWMRFLNWTAKCQNNDIETQYNKGVRVFDFRIRCTKEEFTDHFAHGIVSYSTPYYTTPYLFIKEFLLKHSGVTQVRIMAEDTFTKDFDYNRFNSIAEGLKKRFQNINFIIVHSKKNGGTDGYSHYVDFEDYYLFSWKKFIPFPWLYSKLHKTNAEYELSESRFPYQYLIFKDFI